MQLFPSVPPGEMVMFSVPYTLDCPDSGGGKPPHPGDDDDGHKGDDDDGGKGDDDDGHYGGHDDDGHGHKGDDDDGGYKEWDDDAHGTGVVEVSERGSNTSDFWWSKRGGDDDDGGKGDDDDGGKGDDDDGGKDCPDKPDFFDDDGGDCSCEDDKKGGNKGDDDDDVRYSTSSYGGGDDDDGGKGDDDDGGKGDDDDGHKKDCPDEGDPVELSFFARATASSGCGEVVVESDPCTILCGACPEPCVEVACKAPDWAKDGETIEIKAIAKNCSELSESITIEIFGPEGSLGSKTFDIVPPHLSVQYVVPYTVECPSDPHYGGDDDDGKGDDDDGGRGHYDDDASSDEISQASKIRPIIATGSDGWGSRWGRGGGDDDDGGKGDDDDGGKGDDDDGGKGDDDDGGKGDDDDGGSGGKDLHFYAIAYASNACGETSDKSKHCTVSCGKTSGGDDDDDSRIALDVNSGINQLQLYRPSPNPFTGVTQVAYAVSGSGSQRVDIAIYNIAGRKIRTLVSGQQFAGTYQISWDAMDDAGRRVAPGVYFVGGRIGGAKFPTTRVVFTR